MAKKMLIDATHAEETRVVVVDGNKVEEFDFESENKRQLAGNIYLAKVTRVEPSLQAAFVDYGGNRHGFLAFSEIHPDYYQIPVADREALLEEERAYAETLKSREDEDEKPKPRSRSRSRSRSQRIKDDVNSSLQEQSGETASEKWQETSDTKQLDISGMETIDLTADSIEETSAMDLASEGSAPDLAQNDEKVVGSLEPALAPPESESDVETDALDSLDDAKEGNGNPKEGKTIAAKTDSVDPVATKHPKTGEETLTEDADISVVSAEETVNPAVDVANSDEVSNKDLPTDNEDGPGTNKPVFEDAELSAEAGKEADADSGPDTVINVDEDGEGDVNPARTAKGAKASDKDENIESVADEDDIDDIRPQRKPRPRRYKIQEVIKVRQILLVQVVKEERGNKGAALTTYLSLAGRYCVLMPNTARGGGISRKITNAADRKKLKEIASEIEVPQGAGLIVRTAGAKRTKTEIKRDYEYLKRLWEQIRELTLKSIAPSKIYEEGDLIKRSIRDLYNREIDEVHVEGERGYRIAKDFMKMIMPSHAKNVKHYTETLPLFARYQVETYLSGMFNPTVQLKSGGYIVIGVTEALVAIDVNSGRATKEGSIEETALKTNLEAADEVARQLRLRDLAGLIVIDFIDMDERKNNAAVEKRMKDKLKTDRARIQVGRISGFGLMEMSRQRLRPGMIEATTQPCPACHGTGLIRSDDNLALSILRQIEEEGTRRRSREVLVKCPVAIANYIMNQKREHVAQIEARYGLSVRIEGETHLVSPDFTFEKFKTATRVVAEAVAPVVSADISLMDEVDEMEVAELPDETPEDETKPKKRRRRRRRRGKSSGAEAVEAEGDIAEAVTETADGAQPEVFKITEADNVDAMGTEAKQKSKSTKTRNRSRGRSNTKKFKDTETKKQTDGSVDDASSANTSDQEVLVQETLAVAQTPAKSASLVVNGDVLSETNPEILHEVAVNETASESEAIAVEQQVTDPQKPIDPTKPKRRGWWSMGR